MSSNKRKKHKQVMMVQYLIMNAASNYKHKMCLTTGSKDIDLLYTKI